MAIEGNSSNEKVAKGVNLCTGIINFKVAGFNLTSDELVAAGFNKPKEEPVYTDIQVGNDIFNKVTIYIYNDELKIKMKFDILVKPEVQLSSQGKTRFTSSYSLNNNQLQSFYAIDEEAALTHSEQYPNMLNALTLRPAMYGEVQLNEFIYNWLNIRPDGECYLEEFEKEIAIGNVSVLNTFAKSDKYKNNIVSLLVGVTDKGYMTVYTGLFMRPTLNSSKLLTSVLTNNKFKANFQNSFKVQEYVMDFVPALEETNATKDEDLF